MIYLKKKRGKVFMTQNRINALYIDCFISSTNRHQGVAKLQKNLRISFPYIINIDSNEFT
jgi:hypothetical protein